MDCSLPGSSVHGILQARVLEWGACPSSGDLPNPGIDPRSPTLQDSLLPEPAGKPKNTGVGSLSLLLGILLTQELNCGLLYCKQVLYQLSYQGSPSVWWLSVKESAGDTKDASLIPGLGRSPGVGNGNLLWYSCLGNAMDRGGWRATVHAVPKVSDMTY